ncbi:hypothetical protein E2C01_054533 [Portunus trituberculatus]|uniref:Uncharacterized protein n=1 Tax=Portunus trituberculatus TaxID=210409 RepID=A0A5B7GTY6_PORTR|nr:hypothetical protein [Portunus trituberculatus]
MIQLFLEINVLKWSQPKVGRDIKPAMRLRLARIQQIKAKGKERQKHGIRHLDNRKPDIIRSHSM